MNSVRIIGGRWRRQVLRFPDSLGLRPTPDRVRETLFNWLGQDLAGMRCLDLFAGSGALGMEAASRGAARVLMVELAPPVARALKENIDRLGAGDIVELLRKDGVEFATSSSQRFDVVFLDPPYRQGWLDKVAPLLPRLLSEEGSLYVEAEMSLESLGDFVTVKQGKAGQVYYHLMRRQAPNP